MFATAVHQTQHNEGEAQPAWTNYQRDGDGVVIAVAVAYLTFISGLAATLTVNKRTHARSEISCQVQTNVLARATSHFKSAPRTTTALVQYIKGLRPVRHPTNFGPSLAVLSACSISQRCDAMTHAGQ